MLIGLIIGCPETIEIGAEEFIGPIAIKNNLCG
jgi:hypothetical protein